MFDSLSQRLQATLNGLRGAGRLTEENMAQTLREVRMALLEADVALPVVKAFIERVRSKAGGQEVLRSLTPGQALIKIVNDELVALLGEVNDSLDLTVRPPAVILMAGLQGCGKTTTVVKLARLLREREKKKVLVASTDVYRPAAMEQLQRLAAAADIACLASDAGQAPLDIADAALTQARTSLIDVVIIDTAGRLHIDREMMAEIRALHAAVSPVETLLVADSMTGQDAVNTAKAFGESLPLTGVVLTKTDGDARGGAALSIRYITGKPIKFLGTGEKLDALEPFYPERLASRILGMGDILSIVEQAERTADREQAQKLATKLGKGKGFDLEDFRTQLRQMQEMGGIASLIERLPGISQVPEGVKAQLGDDQFRRFVAIINSMTPAERRFPDIIRGSRKRRIAQGSGTQVQGVNRLLKQFTQMQKMMKRMGKGGMKQMLRGMQAQMRGRSS
jgi:signal recognition particle subunit SRP54